MAAENKLADKGAADEAEAAGIEVFSAPNCSYCDAAKALLWDKGLAFTERDISENGHRKDLLTRLPRNKAVPQIFIGDAHIGGYEDLCLLDDLGRLAKMTGGAG